MDKEMNWLLEEKYHGVKSDAFYADCKRLALGEPLAYLIGWSPFLSTKIWLTSKPLIPRPETEYWTELAIKEIEKNKAKKILDLCAGSGCIGTAVAKELLGTQVDFVEIDKSHLETIKENLEKNEIEADRYQVFHSNLFTELEDKYDFILSNPPYIDAELKRTDDSVIKNEPYVALFGGEKGLEIIAEIIAKAPNYLNPAGQLWLEHEPEQTAAINELGKNNHFQVSTQKDQFGVERYSVLVLQ